MKKIPKSLQKDVMSDVVIDLDTDYIYLVDNSKLDYMVRIYDSAKCLIK